MYVLEHTIDALLDRILLRIKPTDAEKDEEEKLSEELTVMLRKAVPPFIEVSLAGSMAKGTNLRGDRDFDLFLLFPLSHSVKDLEIMGLEWAKKAFASHKWHIGYAEHPYLRAVYRGSKVDIVPSFKISHIEEKASSVDRSPLHTQFVNSKLSRRQKDQVRLLKKFLKNLGIYGAELKTEGFSGYLCELLIAYYGSLVQLLKSAEQWKGQIVLDIEKHYEEHELAGRFLSPLVVIDPVDRDRNVSAVVSQTAMNRLVYASREFLKNPGEKFFFAEQEELSAAKARKLIKDRGTMLLAVQFPAPEVVPDILWPQLKRAEKNIAKHMELAGFSLLGSAHWSDESRHCALLFEFSVSTLPSVRKAHGPPVFQALDCENFIGKHKNAWVEGDRLVALEKRVHTTAESMLRSLLKNPRECGIPDNIAKMAVKGRILAGSAAVRKETLEPLTDYLEKPLP